MVIKWNYLESNERFDAILFADDLVLCSECMESMRKKFLKWNKTFESKEIKVNLEKAKMMVRGSNGKIPKSRVDSCALYGKKVIVNLVLSLKYSTLTWLIRECLLFWQKILLLKDSLK